MNGTDESVITQAQALEDALLVLMEMRPREGGQKGGCFYLPEFEVSGHRKSGGRAEIGSGATSACFLNQLFPVFFTLQWGFWE